MIVNKNQLGRTLLQRFVEDTKVDMQVAMRFFYNSDFYASLQEESVNEDLDMLYSQFLHEFECATKGQRDRYIDSSPIHQ